MLILGKGAFKELIITCQNLLVSVPLQNCLVTESQSQINELLLYHRSYHYSMVP